MPGTFHSIVAKLEVPRLFAWTEEDGNIASLISEPGFGSTGQTAFEKDLDAALSKDMKEADASSTFESIKNGLTFQNKPYNSSLVSSTSLGNPATSSSSLLTGGTKGRNNHKVDKADPRSRYHYVKYVKRHGRTVKLWECGICGREFQHQYTLMRHLPTHTDERNFHCDACSKSFRQLSTLSQHRAIHSAARPYSCEVCYKTFNRVSTLISHRKTHSNEKPYKCHLCPKGFHQKGNLRNHLFTHTNERPYRCNICMKGFNQQSNLVCHKNKAHPDENFVNNSKNSNTVRALRPTTETQADSTRPSTEQCEVTSTVPFIPLEPPMLWPKPSWDISKLDWDICNENPWGSNGVIVDPIKTYHMGVALATRQTPFALLKSDNNTPVLVKVVDTKLPGGKQMLVPATAEDLKIGGKIILNSEDNSTESEVIDIESPPADTAVQIRVPVVATVVPRMRPGVGLQLSVEEPHHAYTLANGNGSSTGCTITPSTSTGSTQRLESNSYDHNIKPGRACTPPADLISLDLFEPMGCIPLGPQITTADNIDQASNDSDIFIRKLEESVPLSDSD
ncbi:unnamed protein product, partial [Brenthis ino]